MVSTSSQLLVVATYRNAGPGTDDSSKELTAADVDIFGTEGDEVIGRADGVGGDVDS